MTKRITLKNRAEIRKMHSIKRWRSLASSNLQKLLKDLQRGH